MVQILFLVGRGGFLYGLQWCVSSRSAGGIYPQCPYVDVYVASARCMYVRLVALGLYVGGR